ncbi:MAG: HlyD family efflux transporter periplasmic adaptor subunit [Burkholderiaceae bacterium]
MPSSPPWPPLREELRIEPAAPDRDGSPAWHVCDPVRNSFYRIGWLEFECLLRWPHGDAGRIADAIAAGTPLHAERADVERFAAFLRRHQLVQSARPAPPQAGWRWLLANYLFVRIPLVRPARLLAALRPFADVFYGRAWLALTVLAGLAGLALAGRQWDTVTARLEASMTVEGFAAFAVAIVASKLLHEFGHAMTATRHGVRVGHMGIALLVLWPMPYTDTGESWKLRRARDRFAIASAGIAAELMLAAWATLAWAFMPDGAVRDALFFLATTAWVATVAINASPFMRFDGYYMLCDLVDVPGLHERAGHEAKRMLRRLVMGLPEPTGEPLAPGRRRALAAFAFATWSYRLLLFVGIALLVYHAFFKALGLFLFAVEITVFILRPIANEARHWWRHRAEGSRQRQWAVGLLAAGAAIVVAIPWPTGIDAPGVLRAGIERPIYAPFSARLVALPVREGQPVRAADVLAVLDAPVQGDQRDQAEAMAAAWNRAARGALGADDAPAARLALAEQQASVWRVERQAREAELSRLQLASPGDGEVRDIDPLLVPGSWIAPDRPIAVVVDGRRWRAEALVGERDRARLRPGTPATAIVVGRTTRLDGRIVGIDGGPARRLPHALLAKPHGGPIALDPNAPPRDLRPAETWYRVTVEGELDEPVTATRAVRLHFEGRPERPAARWADAAVSALVRQGGL